MIYFIDEYIDNMLRSLKLCPNVDVNFTLHLGMLGSELVEISIFWSVPHHNLGWYPIGQIDHHGITVFHFEGSENSDLWDEVPAKMADFLEAKFSSKEDDFR